MHEGEVISDKYILVRRLGAGGMGEVWLARHQFLNRQVALKFLYPDSLSACTKKEIKRLIRDLSFIQRLDHPNIVQVRDFEPYQDSYFIVMDYIDGKDIRNLITANHLPKTQTQIIYYVTQILSALSAAHKHNIIHRNVSPSKIFIDKNGKVYLSGFIDAVIMDYHYLHNKRLFGTIVYQSIADVDKPNITTDLYSLGVIMYEITTGKLPFWGDVELEVKLGFKPPIAPNEINEKITSGLSSIIMKAIQIRLEKRFQSAEEMAEALETCRNKRKSDNM